MVKRIMISVLTIAIVASFVGVSTLAVYTDSASSQGNLFQAGILDLKVNGSDNLYPMTFTAHPGNWGYMDAYQIQMVSSTGPAGKLTYKFDNVAEFGGEYTPPEQAVESPDVGDLSSVAEFRVIYNDGVTWIDDYYTMADLQAGITLTNAFPGEAYMEVDLYLPNAATTNKVQGDYTTCDAHLTLEQAH